LAEFEGRLAGIPRCVRELAASATRVFFVLRTRRTDGRSARGSVGCCTRPVGFGVIEFESVGKTFRDGTVAVVDLDLVVPSHNFTVIVGPSGCGKTTTLRMVNRMLEPTTGRITWDGTPLRSMRKTTLRRQMGYVIQNGGLLPHRTVIENIGTVPALLHWPRKKIAQRSLELLHSVGLERKLAHRYPAQLSGGQQQRVGVARALAADPLVLLMDEPFSAVDPVVRSELHEFFLELQRELGKTIIFITHDIDEAIKLGDQVAIMRVGGHLVQVGRPQQLLDEPVDAFVEGFVGRDRGFRSLSFQPASVLSLDRVKVVRDVETASGGRGPILVVDGDARPVGWADPQRPGGVFPLGSTFSPETDSLRVALDSALTSLHGLAVAVTADTRRYAGVVSADTILAKVKAVRASIAESIAIREAEAARALELPADPADGPQPPGDPEQEYESTEVFDQLAEPKPAFQPEQVYDQLAELEHASQPEEVYDQLAEPEQAEPDAYQPEQVYDQQTESEAHQAKQVLRPQAQPDQAYESTYEYHPLSDEQQAHVLEAVEDRRPQPEQAPEPTDGYDPLADQQQAHEPGEVEDQRAQPEQPPESTDGYDPLADQQQAHEWDEVEDQRAQLAQADEWHHAQNQRAQPQLTHEWDQIYDQLAEPEPTSHADPNEGSSSGLHGDVASRSRVDAQRGNGIDEFADLKDEDESETAPDADLLIEGRGKPDRQDEGRNANGEALHRRGSSVLQ
jgi:osmoprotectant transport system ATP-binding protein